MKGMFKEIRGLRRMLMGKKCQLAAQELADQAGKFEGLYEPAWLVVQDPQHFPSPLGEWITRAERISPDGALARYLLNLERAKPKKQGKRLLRLISTAGIRREDCADRVLTFSGLQTQAYAELDGHRIREGETLSLLKSAWYKNDRIVEHGLAGELQ